MSFEELRFDRYNGKRVLLDSNLLLLLLVGSFSPDLIASCQRTSTYTRTHYDLLVNLLLHFSAVVTTPHVLTEVSNLAGGSLHGQTKLVWFAHFAQEIPKLNEISYAGKAIAQETAFVTFGITDAALKMISKDTLLLTEDRKLAGHLKSYDLPALHFGDLVTISTYLNA